MPSTTEIIPTTKPPLVNVISFTSYIRCIYALKFGQYRTLFCLANSSVSSMPYMQSLFVRPRLCFGLPSDSASRRTLLPSANSSYCHACSGLSPPCCIACRAHQQKAVLPTGSHCFFVTNSVSIFFRMYDFLLI